MTQIVINYNIGLPSFAWLIYLVPTGLLLGWSCTMWFFSKTMLSEKYKNRFTKAARFLLMVAVGTLVGMLTTATINFVAFVGSAVVTVLAS